MSKKSTREVEKIDLYTKIAAKLAAALEAIQKKGKKFEVILKWER